MKKMFIPILLIHMVLSLLSCSQEIRRMENGDINQNIYPYLEFTYYSSGDYYTASVMEGAKLEHVSIPGFIQSEDGKKPVKVFTGFKNPMDAEDLKVVFIDINIDEVSPDAFEYAKSLEKVVTTGIKECQEWAKLPIFILSNGYHFHGWKIGDSVYEGGTTIPLDPDSPAAIPFFEKLEHHAAQEPSCTEEGNKEYWECLVCHSIFEDDRAENEAQWSDIEIPSLGGHLYPDEWTVVSEATCTEPGLKTKTCLREGCGYILEEEISALGHDFGEWHIEIESTCTEGGRERRDCSRCDIFETRSIDPIGHDYGDWTTVTEPTCTGNGQEKRVCARCGDSETRRVPALGHDLGEWYVYQEATCTEEGEERRDCSRCDHFESRVIEAKGHTSDGKIYGKDNPDQHWYHCDIDNVDYGHEPHTYGGWESTEEPGKKAQRICTVCGHIEYTELEHIWDFIEPVEPDCTTSGNYGYWKCEIHENEYTSDEAHNVPVTWKEIFRPAKGHAMAHHPYKAATCREDGNKEYWRCSVCGKNFSDSKGETELTDILLPHHSVNAISSVSPTCTESGNIAYWYCVDEEKYFSNEECTVEITQVQTIIGVLGHDHTGDWVNTDETYHWKMCERDGCEEILDKEEHFYEITYDFDSSNRNLTMTSVCKCGRNLSSSITSDTGAFDISTVFGAINVTRLSNNSWKISADSSVVKYCRWTGDDGVTLLTGPDAFTISCEIAGSGTYKIFCHVTDRFGKEIDIYFVEFTKHN